MKAKSKWKVVTGNNGSTQVLLDGVTKRTAKLYAKGFNGRCKTEGLAKRARLEKCEPEEHGLWLVIGHSLRDDDYTPYEVLSIETNYDSAVNVSMGVNSMTQQTGLCADVLDLNYFPKVGVHNLSEVKQKALALGHHLYDMADQIKPQKGKPNLPEASEEPELQHALPKATEELPKLYVEVTGFSDETRYISVTDPRATMMATFEDLNPGSKCRAIDTPEWGEVCQ